MTGRELIFRPTALTIACTDLDRSRRFYKDVLGASPDPRDGYGCPWFRLGAWSITLMPNAAERSQSSFPDHAMTILWLEVDDLGAAERLFARHQVEVIQPSDGQFMMIADPDGLMIEVWQAE
ncbi:Catechol 2,3-dioxygenase [Singulisphaera sp. GP187]|uniref:VOC family protein n=1 Tax=Singulisphaera sp. GP187 TaxID=1882752 RepID=UPI00092AAA6F|nr:VOC family protein [Singulisphaera sp. GP187]SIO58831.1 Catechol 2,3-dioxygenase [Singulisphaera sp. GP187]